jgi:hypothetical protein
MNALASWKGEASQEVDPRLASPVDPGLPHPQAYWTWPPSLPTFKIGFGSGFVSDDGRRRRVRMEES